MKQGLRGPARIVLFVAAVSIAMKVIGPRIGEVMERKFEEAPDDFPPKWMFLNITAIRETNERILSLLEERTEQPEGGQGDD